MAADVKISALQALLGASVAPQDLLVAVDISDQSMAATGTDKKLTVGSLTEYLATALQVSGVNTGDVTITTGTGLGLVGQLLSLDFATALLAGSVSIGGQEFGGAKTFKALVTMEAGATVTGTTASTVFRSGAGSAGATAYGTAGDENTGIWFPSADSMNFVTGGTLRLQLSSTGALFPNTIESSGNLFKFSSASASKITWDAGGANRWEVEATPGSGVLRFGNNSSTYMALRFSDGFTESSFGFESPVFRAPTAGGSLELQGWLGSVANSVAVRIGTRAAQNTLSSTARVVSMGSGMAGSYSEGFWLDKDGGMHNGISAGLAKWFGAGSGNVWIQIDDINGINGYLAGFQFWLDGGGFRTNAPMVAQNTIQLNTDGNARPAAQASNRGKIWYSRSGAGVADTVEMCLKSAADAYAWVTIATG
jgi:hypothetical protein